MQTPQLVVNNLLLQILLERLKQLDSLDSKLDALKKIDSIDKKLTAKNPKLLVKDAIRGFRHHLKTGLSRRGTRFRKPENYDYILQCFGKDFGSKNLPDVTPAQIDAFIRKYWDSPGTLKQRIAELSAFFNWAILNQKKQRLPIFNNPCGLLDPIAHKIKSPKFIPVKAMYELIESAGNERQWLLFAIMATAGLRISEVLKLTKDDIKGRVLILIEPKSGNDEEIAVIPEKVAKRLAAYAKGFMSDEPLFDLRRSTAFKSLQARGYNPHALRKWCITYWARKGDTEMELFVRRHSRTTLRDRYVAPLTTAEAMKRQNVMSKELW